MGGLALFLLPGGRPLRFGTGAGVGGSAGTVAGAGSGSGSAGSAGSAAAGSGSEATAGSAFSAISFKIILLLVVQENRKGNAGPAGIHHVAVYICQFEAQGAQGNGAVQFDEMTLVRASLHNVPHAFVDNHFANDVLPQRTLDVGSRGQCAASEQQLRVRIHGDEGKDLQGTVDEGGPQQVVDAQGAGRRGARRVAPGAREEASDLIIVQDTAVAVVGDFKDGLTAGCAVLVQNGRDQGHRLPGFARPEEDSSARHAGNDRVARLF